MKDTELTKVLEAHAEWSKDSLKGERANLYEANLTGANLYEANLTRANLTGANLYEANLTRANLTGANLYEANFTRANLYEANLTGANLYRANLTGASLTGANLTRANLTGANLYEANLTRANFTRANLTEANLTGANLTGTNLTGARLPHFQICPEEGAFIGWKKLAGGIVAKLLIVEDAKRTSSLVGRKCRASAVQVLGFFGRGGLEEKQPYTWSMRGGTFYEIGKVVTPDSYDGDIRVECTHGIHFFMTRREAEEYL